MKHKVDQAHRMTDAEIAQLEKRIERVYEEASKDIQFQMDAFFSRFERKNGKWLKDIKSGAKTEEEYQKWLKGQVFMGKRWQRKKEDVAIALNNANNVALAMANGSMDRVFLNNANYMAYIMENGEGVDFNFELYDKNIIKALQAEDADILPYKKLDKAKDMKWNFQGIKNTVSSGIIQGQSIKDIAKRLATDMPNRSKAMITTHARTMLNSAHNQGRQARFEEAAKKGIKFKRRWNAVLDGRTRYAHAFMDGQEVGVFEPFKFENQEIMYPSDPHAHPSLTYNCRCDVEIVIEGYPPEYRRDNEAGEIIDYMTYKEWYESKGGNFDDLKPKKKGEKKE